MRTSRWLLSVVCVVCVAVCPLGAADKPLMRVEKDAKTGQLVVREGDRVVLQYNYRTVQPPKGYIEKVKGGNRKYALPRSNYIHPLYGPEGELLTLDWSKDHPHHRGIYWAWPEVQHKGQMRDLHALQGVFARPTGKVSCRSGAEFAEVTGENCWMWGDKTPIVRETATIRAWRSGKDGRFIDLTYTFTALEDGVTLARRGMRAYGGLNVRLSPIKGMKLVHHADKADAKGRQAWQAAAGTWKGATKPAALVVFEKATNPQYPGDYIQYPYLPWFQPTFPRAKTRYALTKSKTLVLRYRLWIKSGAAPTEEQFRRQWRAYQNAKPQESTR